MQPVSNKNTFNDSCLTTDKYIETFFSILFSFSVEEEEEDRSLLMLIFYSNNRALSSISPLLTDLLLMILRRSCQRK